MIPSTDKKAVKDGKIPPELAINWDQTGVNVVPSSQWTQAEKELQGLRLLELEISDKLLSP